MKLKDLLNEALFWGGSHTKAFAKQNIQNEDGTFMPVDVRTKHDVQTEDEPSVNEKIERDPKKALVALKKIQGLVRSMPYSGIDEVDEWIDTLETASRRAIMKLKL